MRIALVSTPFVPVPPPRYGGTELIVAELLQGLTARGHDVTLFATGDSRAPPRARVRALFDRAHWPPDPHVELAHASFAVEHVLRDPAGFDVMHVHVPAALPFAALLDVPMVCTVHHERDPRLAPLYHRTRAQIVAISERQRELAPELTRARVIHHGVTAGRYRCHGGAGGYAAFLGRFSVEKGPHQALDAAARAGVPLRLAGRPHWGDFEYHRDQVEPRIARASRGVVQLMGEVGGAEKTRFLGEACALLFPVAWEEPFGLVMIEAMMCGTPVLAFDRGSVREVVDDGVTGFVCEDARDMADHLRRIARDGFDRAACAQRARERWRAERMVDDYERLYLSLLGFRYADQRAAAPLA